MSGLSGSKYAEASDNAPVFVISRVDESRVVKLAVGSHEEAAYRLHAFLVSFPLVDNPTARYTIEKMLKREARKRTDGDDGGGS